MGNGWDWGWGGWAMMILLIALFWGGLVAGAVVVVRYGRARRRTFPPPADRARSALEVLDERFARGEIDADEYTRRRHLLRSGR